MQEPPVMTDQHSQPVVLAETNAAEHAIEHVKIISVYWTLLLAATVSKLIGHGSEAFSPVSRKSLGAVAACYKMSW